MSSIVGYLVAQNGLGLDPLWSLCIGGLSAGGVYLCNAIGKTDNKLMENEIYSLKTKRSKKSK